MMMRMWLGMGWDGCGVYTVMAKELYFFFSQSEEEQGEEDEDDDDKNNLSSASLGRTSSSCIRG